MKSGKNLQPTEDFSEEIEEKNTLSIDEFFKQLEEKEKDLDISTELVIEIEGNDFDEIHLASLPNSASSADRQEKPEKSNGGEKQQKDALLKLENKISALQKQVSKMESERVELLEISRRRQTDFESYKKRVERERSETFLNQLSNLATQILPVLDNFNRAFDSASSSADEKVLDSQNFFNGIILVNQQLNEVLSEMGVSPIISVGKLFDPHLHEAVATEETNEIPPNTITAELMRGYRIGERVIRPSMVRVSVGQELKVENQEAAGLI